MRRSAHGNLLLNADLLRARAFLPGMQEAGENAVTWFRKSAELGFAPAMNDLGEMYRLGVGVRADPEKAFRWHLRAAEAGNPGGATNVALDNRGGLGTQVDTAAAARWEDIDLSKASPDDLAEPTFGRTLVFGIKIPDDQTRHDACRRREQRKLIRDLLRLFANARDT